MISIVLNSKLILLYNIKVTSYRKETLCLKKTMLPDSFSGEDNDELGLLEVHLSYFKNILEAITGIDLRTIALANFLQLKRKPKKSVQYFLGLFTDARISHWIGYLSDLDNHAHYVADIRRKSGAAAAFLPPALPDAFVVDVYVKGLSVPFWIDRIKSALSMEAGHERNDECDAILQELREDVMFQKHQRTT